MNNLYTLIIENLKEVVALFVAVVGVITVALKALELRTNTRFRKLDFLRNSLREDSLSHETREALQEAYEKALFDKYVGIFAEKPLRNALTQLVQRSGGRICWHSLRTAKGLIDLEEGSLFVRWGWAQRAGMVFLGTMAFLTAAIGITAFGLTLILVLSEEKHYAQAAVMFVATLFALGELLFFLVQLATYIHAKQIREYLANTTTPETRSGDE